jgi:subtilisin family serine protease
MPCEEADYYKTLTYLNSHGEFIDFAEPEMEMAYQSYPNDELYPGQASLVYNPSIPNAGIRIEEAWDIETGKPFVKIGVLDAGIDSVHPDLEVLYGGAYYRTALGTVPAWGVALESHGTQVAGIIAARRNNGIGIAGIAGGDGSDSSGVSLIDLRFPFFIRSFGKLPAGGYRRRRKIGRKLLELSSGLLRR